MDRQVADPQAMMLHPDALVDLFGPMEIDVAASGTVDDQQEVAIWRCASDDSPSPVNQGRIAGCELTCASPDSGMAALTSNAGVFSVTTRVATYESATAAADALQAIARWARDGHGPAGIAGTAPTDVRLVAPDAERLGGQGIGLDLRFANPTAPDPHPVTLSFTIPPHEWQERWMLLHREAVVAAVIIRFVGSDPEPRTIDELQRRVTSQIDEALLGAQPLGEALLGAQPRPLWMLAEETVAGRFRVAYEASSSAFREATREALADIDRALPGRPARIRVLRSPTMGEHNAGGLTRADGSVLLYVRLENLDLVPRILKSILAHEIHHSVRNTEGPGREDLNSLLGTMILEGLGTVFQLDVCPDIPIRYADALDPATEAALWYAAQTDLGRPLGPLAAEWFYGRGQAPRWAGYTIGTHIVQGYLATHPGLTAADLVATDAAAILAGSTYAP